MMSLTQQLEMMHQNRCHHHHRSASQGLDFVMGLALSVDGSDISDQLPLPQTHRRSDQGTDNSKRAFYKPIARQRSATLSLEALKESNPANSPEIPLMVQDGAKSAAASAPLSELFKSQPGSGNPLDGASTPINIAGSSQSRESPEPIQMSLVSPPFTPSISQVDLSSSEKLGTPEPISLPASTTANVRSKLDDTLPNVFCESRARIPTTTGEEIFLHVYRNNVDTKEHLAIVFGQDIHSKTLFAKREGETEHDRMTRGAYTGKLYPGRQTSGPDSELPELKDEAEASNSGNQDVLCRIHSECYTGETAWSARCDCGEQLDEAARLMSKAGRGVIVYLRQEGRGIGLGEKLKAYNLQDLGADTVQANLMLRHPADGRSFGLATAILLDLGLDHIRLMTNNPDKIVAVEGKNKEITVTQRVPMIPLSWQKKGGFQSAEVDKYLATKIERMGHLLDR